MMDFREMPYTRPDMQKVRDAYTQAIACLKQTDQYPVARQAFFDLQKVQIELGTLMSLCSVRNTIDTTDAFYDAEIRWLRSENAQLLPLRKVYEYDVETVAGCASVPRGIRRGVRSADVPHDRRGTEDLG